MKLNIDIRFNLLFIRPFHLSSGMGVGKINRTVRKDVNGFLYVPGSTLKGVLRDWIGEIINCFNDKSECMFNSNVINIFDKKEHIKFFKESQQIIDRIFGSPVQESGIHFHNMYMDRKDKLFFETFKELQKENRTQNRIYRSTKTGADKALFSTEFGVKDISFNGRINGLIEGIGLQSFESDNPALKDGINYEVLFLVMGLKLFNKIGSNKSSGMGEFIINDLSINVNGKVVSEKDIITDISMDSIEVMFEDDREAFYAKN